MPVAAKIAIVAALEREIKPLVKAWSRVQREFDGRRLTFFERENAVVVCGGMGAEAARRATEAVIQMYAPELVISAGFAGALQVDLQVGQVLAARTVIDASDGSRVETGAGNAVLVCFSTVADAKQKAMLAKAYGAQAVDMESSAVARGAQAHGIRFMAYKAISDANDFRMPPVERFVGTDGQFHSVRFALHGMWRPWLWSRVLRLARNSAVASKRLCQELEVLSNTLARDAGAPATLARMKS